jgi:hypothetical protein
MIRIRHPPQPHQLFQCWWLLVPQVSHNKSIGKVDFFQAVKEACAHQARFHEALCIRKAADA